MKPRRKLARSQRTALALTLPVAAALALGACGGPPSNSTQAVTSALTLRLTTLLGDYGFPIPSDRVGCAGPGKNGGVACFGESDNTPPDRIQAEFQAKDTKYSPGHCPGVLVVDANGSRLTKVNFDPCA